MYIKRSIPNVSTAKMIFIVGIRLFCCRLMKDKTQKPKKLIIIQSSIQSSNFQFESFTKRRHTLCKGIIQSRVKRRYSHGEQWTVSYSEVHAGKSVPCQGKELISQTSDCAYLMGRSPTRLKAKGMRQVWLALEKSKSLYPPLKNYYLHLTQK